MKRRVLQYRLLLLLTVSPFFRGTSPLLSAEYQTKNLFLVIIDGTRNDEAFEDTLHQYIPHLWNDLRPLGTMYTNFYNTSIAYTTSGHVTLLTGNRNNLPNADDIPCEPLRPRFPTIFEYYRKDNGISQNGVWIVAGKDNLSTIDYSLFPGYGLEYAASIYYDTGSDSTTITMFHDVMDQYHPSLALLNLKDVDTMGHLGIWERYTSAISYADSLVWDLWQRIENDSYYQGKTTLLITTDHGRHDDQHGGFSDHGGTDHGSQHVFFLAIGPDIKQDTVVTYRRDQIDVAPTIGELLSFQTPFVAGTVLSEMIVEPPRLGNLKEDSGGDKLESIPATRITYTSSMSLSPSVTKSPSYLHLIWTESDSSTIPEKKRVMYSKKDKIYGYWSAPVPLFQDTDSSMVLTEGEIHSFTDGSLSVIADALFELPDSLGRNTYKWSPVSSISPDGDSWSETIILDDFANGNRDIISRPPAVYTGEGIITASWITGDRWFIMQRSTDGGNSFFPILSWRPSVGQQKLQFFSPCLIESEIDHVSVLECNFYHYSRIIFGSLNAVIEDPESIVLLDEGKEPSFYPSLSKASERLHYAWSDISEGIWQIYYKNSLHDGSDLSELINLSHSPTAAFKADIQTTGDSIVVAWEDYRNCNPEIYTSMSTDDGVHWTDPMRMTFTPGNSTNPAIVLHEDLISLLWQDDSDGNWEIYYEELPLASLPANR